MEIENKNMNKTLEEWMSEYIDSLNEKDKISYLIAKNFLGSSFDLEKSNGFLEFMKSKNKKI